MDTHRIEVFDRTDNDAIVLVVPYHFHFIFFPTENRLLDQQFIGRRKIQPALTNFDKLFLVIGNSATTATHGERRTDNRRETDLRLHLDGFFHAMRDGRTGHVETNLAHGLAEPIPVLGFVDGIPGGANHFHIVLFQHAFPRQIEGAVQCRLPTHGGQQRIGAFFLNDFGNHSPINRFNIGSIGHLGIGHDGSRIGIDQNNPITLFPERLAGLCTRIVKLTGLTDHNRTGTDNQDTFDVCSFWHGELQLTGLLVLLDRIHKLIK